MKDVVGYGPETISMNKIVLEHYPAEKLPEDLRAGLPADARVRVTVESEPTIKPIKSFAELLALRRPPYRTSEDIVREIRELRDEWDE